MHICNHIVNFLVEVYICVVNYTITRVTHNIYKSLPDIRSIYVKAACLQDLGVFFRVKTLTGRSCHLLYFTLSTTTWSKSVWFVHATTA